MLFLSVNPGVYAIGSICGSVAFDGYIFECEMTILRDRTGGIVLGGVAEHIAVCQCDPSTTKKHCHLTIDDNAFQLNLFE